MGSRTQEKMNKKIQEFDDLAVWQKTPGVVMFLPVFCLLITVCLSALRPSSLWAAIPNAPSGLTATALSSTQIQLTWTDNSTDETSFYIERKTGATGNYSQIPSVGANATTYSNTGLTQNTTYYYRVRAYNASGYSAYSNETSATTATLNAPTNLAVSSVSYTKVTLTWTDISGDETGFSIERKVGAGGTYSQVTTVGANVTTYTNASLTQGTDYYYRVRTYNSPNYSDYSNEVGATTPILPPPSDLTATPLSSTQIKLTWTDNSTDENNFYIEYKTTGNFAYLTNVPSNTTTYTHTNLTQGTACSYRVRAYNSSNSAYSAYSNEASPTTLTLNAPSNLSISATSYTQVTLTWMDNSADETNFYIERKTGVGGAYSQIGSVGANVTTYTNTGLSQGTEYYYRVRAYSNPNYSTYSNETSRTTLTLLSPSNLAATPMSSTQIQLSWTDNSTDETSFYIEYRTTGSYTYLTTVPANTTSYTHSYLNQSTTYSYRVRAYNANSSVYSAYSNEVSATTTTINAPTNLSISAVSYTQLTLTWTDNSGDENGFVIERKTGAGGTYSTIYTTAANATSYTNSYLTLGTEYYYRVRAFIGSNYSQYSNEVSATTLTFNAPSNLVASPLSSSQINLTWTDNSTDEMYFYIEQKMGATGAYSQIAYVPANVAAFTSAGLTQNTTYYYRVRAYNSTGYSSYSNEASATTLTFNAPSNLTASPLSDTQVKLSWTDNTLDEIYFYVEYKIGATGTYAALPSLSANTKTYTHANLTPNTTYYYRVRAYSAGGYSAYSNEASTTTPTCTQEGYYQP